MKAIHPRFSKIQYEFLSIFEAAGEAVSLDVVDSLVPIPPSDLIDLIKKCEECGLLLKAEGNNFTISKGMTSGLKKKFAKLNRRDRLSALLDKIRNLDLERQLPPAALANILGRAGQDESAAHLEITMAETALKGKKYTEAFKIFHRALAHLKPYVENSENATLFIQTSLQLSNLAIATGKYLVDVRSFLNTAKFAAEFMGDKRSEAQINLHIGRLLFFGRRSGGAMRALSDGYEHVKMLGDDDIMNQSAEFLGLYYFAQGLMRKAIKHFEKAIHIFEIGTQNNHLINPSAPMFYGYCSAYLGRFDRAVGTLDYNWRLANEVGLQTLSSAIRAVLGTVLLLIDKKREGTYHLQSALQEAKKHNNFIALYHLSGGILYQHVHEGHMRKASKIFGEMTGELAKQGILPQIISPWTLEILHDFDNLGLNPFPNVQLSSFLDEFADSKNLHIQGVALRLSAQRYSRRSRHRPLVKQKLLESEVNLKRSGDPIQLAKTQTELACLHLEVRNNSQAQILARKARITLSGTWDKFFPNTLRPLLQEGHAKSKRIKTERELDRLFLDFIAEAVPKSSHEDIWRSLLAALNRFFGAERGGLLWLEKNKTNLSLRTGINLNKSEILSKGFGYSKKCIKKSLRENRPLVMRNRSRKVDNIVGNQKGLLCLPIRIERHTRCVFYLDNSYLVDCFDDWTPKQLELFAQYISDFIERLQNYRQFLDQTKIDVRDNTLKALQSNNTAIVHRSSKMIGILKQAKRVAGSDGSVLIQGETGVGKELLARHIHSNSPRCSAPFVPIDATTISENLFESELFGHEKGAFTGADKRKIGRIELANHGTLFIDEIGELPVTMQAKFLRVLEEKKFIRVGGQTQISSDFRLVAATNRDITEQINKGRFRQDLYYRLNVLEIVLPPLRERPDDILPLANHFLSYFAKKYTRLQLKLSSGVEARLTDYNWPGNVRELRNVIERAVIISTGDLIEIDLPDSIQECASHPFDDLPTLNEIQRRYIGYVLRKTRGQIGGAKGAAGILGLKRTSVYTRMKQLDLTRESAMQT